MTPEHSRAKREAENFMKLLNQAEKTQILNENEVMARFKTCLLDIDQHRIPLQNIHLRGVIEKRSENEI